MTTAVAAGAAGAAAKEQPAPAKLLQELLDEYKKVNKKADKPVPTGIKPRGVILPVLTLSLLLIPVIVIFLPVFLSARNTRDKQSSQRTYLCALYPDATVLTAAVLASDACDDALWDPTNQTKARQCADASGRAAALESQYMAALQRNCSRIGPFEWSGSALDDSAEVSYWLDSNRNRYVANPNASAAADQPLVPQDPSAAVVTAFGQMNATLSTVDVIMNTATIDFDLRIQAYFDVDVSEDGDFSYYYDDGEEEQAQQGVNVKTQLIDVKTYRLKKKMGQNSLSAEVITATGSDGMVALRSGDRVASKKLAVALTPITSIYRYPFDQYRGTVKIVSSFGNESYVYPLALLVSQRNALVGWTYEVTQVPRLEDNVVVWGEGDPEYSTVQLTYEIRLQRTSFNRFFAVIILMGMWAYTMFACVYALDMMYFRPRNATLGDAGLFTGLLFAMPNVRNVMPGIPPGIGLGVDFYGFIWIMLLMMITGAMVLCKVVGQYIHLDATLYDRLRRNQVWEDQVLRDLEAAEKKAKEEAEREKERQKKREKWGIAVPPGVAAAKGDVPAGAGCLGGEKQVQLLPVNKV